VIVLPPLYAKIPIFILVCVGLGWLAYKSHWVTGWSQIRKLACVVVVIAGCAVIAIPQFWSQWYSEHPLTTNVPGTTMGVPPTLKSLMEDSLPGDAKFLQDFPIHTPDNTSITIEGALFVDLAGGSEFTAFYIPSSPKTFGAAMFLARGRARTLNQDLALSGRVKSKVPDEKPQNSAFLPHTGRIYIYHDDFLNHRQMAEIEEAFAKQRFDVVLRGPDYINHILEERRKSMLVPVLLQHTHANWLAPGKTDSEGLDQNRSGPRVHRFPRGTAERSQGDELEPSKAEVSNVVSLGTRIQRQPC
jgi:hypothetical protein